MVNIKAVSTSGVSVLYPVFESFEIEGNEKFQDTNPEIALQVLP